MTFEGKRTPAPWKLEVPKGRNDWFKVRGQDGAVVVEIFNGSNARLIAAAPELLAHLRAVARLLERNTMPGPDVMAGIKDIIDKAKQRDRTLTEET